MSSPNPHSRRVRSSIQPDYSDLNGLLSEIDTKQGQIEAYQQAAAEYEKLADDEMEAKKSLIAQTNIVTFIKKRCMEKGITFRERGFSMNDSADIIHEMSFFAGSQFANENIPVLITALKEIGIPPADIHKWLYYVEVEKGGSARQQAVERIFITVSEATFHGLIDKATEERFAQVEERHAWADSHSSAELRDVARFIEEQTGHDIIDEIPEKQELRIFTDSAKARVKADIRRKVTDELLGDLGKDLSDKDAVGR